MTAMQAFENILCQVQSSCLNFKIELSPFSATIFLKKSFVKNQHRIHVHPPPDHAVEVHRDDQNVEKRDLEIENNSLKEKMEIAVGQTLKCNHEIDNLRAELKQKQEIIDSLDLENKDLREAS